MEILPSPILPSPGPCLVAGTKITSILNAFKPNKEKTFEGRGERTKSAYVNGRWSNIIHILFNAQISFPIPSQWRKDGGFIPLQSCPISPPFCPTWPTFRTSEPGETGGRRADEGGEENEGFQKTPDFEKTEMKYDSTGMFHWTPPRSIEDCILVIVNTWKSNTV